MGRINIMVPDELEKTIRQIAIMRFGGKKGSLGKIVEEALREYIERHKAETE